MPSLLTHTHTHTHTHKEAHCLLPVLWLINFPDRACTNIKCSPPFLCRTQSVPLLSCVSLCRAWLISVPPGFWLHLPKMSGQRTSPRRAPASLIFSFSQILLFHICIFLSSLDDSVERFFPFLVMGLSARLVQFPQVLTAFNLLILGSPRAKATVPLLSSSLSACVCFKCFIRYVVYCISCGTLCDPSQFGWVLWRWA